jgi:phosphoribosyl 1,2-cyclic phosphodiesterase
MAAPGPDTIKIGGDTACVEIATDEVRIICDAGTGIRALGKDLERRIKGKSIDAHILLSHLHWDHYIGLPFFSPLYNSKNKFSVCGPSAEGMSFKEAISKAMVPPYFPIPVSALPARIKFRTLSTRRFQLGDVTVLPAELNHPGGALGWRFNFSNGRSLVHITDNEPNSDDGKDRLVRWMRGADILIHDAQYTPRDYVGHKGWGHSPFTYPIELAHEAGIGRVLFFHFDPNDDDKKIKRVLSDARKWIQKMKYDVRCDVAAQGKTISL